MKPTTTSVRHALTLLKLLSSVKLALSRQFTASWAAKSAGFATASSISACGPRCKITVSQNTPRHNHIDRLIALPLKLNQSNSYRLKSTMPHSISEWSSSAMVLGTPLTPVRPLRLAPPPGTHRAMHTNILIVLSNTVYTVISAGFAVTSFTYA